MSLKQFLRESCQEEVTQQADICPLTPGPEAANKYRKSSDAPQRKEQAGGHQSTVQAPAPGSVRGTGNERTIACARGVANVEDGQRSMNVRSLFGRKKK